MNLFILVGFFGQAKFVVEGTPLINPELTNTNFELPNYTLIELDPEGNIVKNEAITKEQYAVYKAKISNNSEKVDFKNSEEIN